MKKFLRTVSVVLAAVLTVSLTAPAAGAAGFSDTSGHWAKTYIDEGVKAGYLSGYRDGSFRPNASVTRGAFCKMLNKALGLEATASISFKDVSSSDTFYSEIQKAVYAGYISGYDDNTFRADKTITRQEAAVMISRVLPAASAEKNLNTLKDGDSVASYAKSGVRKVLSKGYITGNSSGRFNPASPLTRGQTAKIIRTMLKGERIVRGGVDYTTPGKTYSGNIYVGPLNVNMSSGSLTFSNCKLLGMLTVKSGASVKLSDTDAAVLSVTSSALPTVTATGTSWIRSTYLSGAANLTESGLSGTGFDTVALSGSALKSKTVTLRGAFGAVSASSPVKLALPSGSISLLSVASGAAGSSFALSSGTSVASAVLNGSCAFTGSGTIIAAQQNVSGVTYETAPKTVNGSAAETLVPTVTPSNGATGVSVSASVKLQFSSPVYNSNGGLLTSSKIADSVAELRRGSATGSRVSFAASISSDKKLITLSPESSLQSGVTYYVILLSGSVQTASGTQNTRQVFSFTTGKGALAPTPSPSDGATGVSVTVNPTLTFSESVYDASYSGTRTPGSSVLRKTFLLYRGSVSSSRQVDCSVSISGRRVTVVPDSNLDAGTTYYLVVTEDLLKNSDGDTNSYQKFSFTTTGKGTLVPTPSPSDGATGVSVTVNPTLTFSESVYDASYSGTRTPGSSVLRKTFLLYRGSVSSSRQVDCSVSISGRRVTVVPDSNLDTGTTYYLVVTEDLLKNSDGDTNSYQKFSFTTGSETPTVRVYSSTSGADPASSIQLKFSEKVYRSTGSSISNSYAESYIRLYQGSSQISCSVSVSGTTATITPSKTLDSGTKYRISVSSKAFYNSNGNSVEAADLYITTAAAKDAVTDIAASGATLHSLAVTFTANTSATSAIVRLKKQGSDTSTDKTLSSVRIGSNTTEAFSNLEPGTNYDVTVTVKFSGSSEQSFTATLRTKAPALTVESTAVTTDSATVRVSSDYYTGTFSATCSSKDGTITLPCPQTPADSFNIPLQELKPGTEYTVTVTLTYGSGASVASSTRFKTDAISDDSSLLSVTLSGASYTLSGPASGGTITVAAAAGAGLTVTAQASSTTAEVSINGSTAELGSVSAALTPADGEQLVVVVKAQNGTSSTYTYTFVFAPPQSSPAAPSV